MKIKMHLLPVIVLALAGFVLPSGADVSMPTNNLRVWLKADAITGLNSGDTVSNWVDSSGLGFDAVQTNGDRQPFFYSNAVNGLPVVRFSRTNDYLQNLAYTNPVQEVSVFMVARRLGSFLGGSYQNLFIGGTTSYTFAVTFYQLNYELSGLDLVKLNFNTATLDINPTASSWPTDRFTLINFFKSVSVAAGRPDQLHMNGSLMGAGSGAQNLGSGYFLGSWNANDANFEVAELLIYGAALSTPDRQSVEGYLAVKYGINSLLPLDHPWRNVASASALVENRPATAISLTGASLNGYLSSTGTAATAVSVVWGLENAGPAASGLWQATNTWAFGEWEAGESVSHAATGLESNRIYYYRYATTNAAGFSESTNVFSFMTGFIDVTAPDPAGVEGDDPLTFVLSRPPLATNMDLVISVSWSGAALPGADFLSTEPRSNVLLRAGRVSTNLTVFPVDDPLSEPEEALILSVVTGGLFAVGGSSATGTVAASAARAPARTIGHWRFETIPGIQADSSGNGYCLTSSLAASYQPALATNGPSSAFPRTIYDSGRPNARCFSHRGGVPYAPAFTATVFTVEAFVSIMDDASGWRPIASRWRGMSNAERSWIFGVHTNEQRLTLLYFSNVTFTVRAPTAAFDLQTNTDYYVSVAVDGGKVGTNQQGVLFRIKNLTDNTPLVSGYADLPSGGLQPATGIAFEVRQFGEYGSQVYGTYTGRLDELRFSAGFLDDDQLMIQGSRAGTVIFLR